MIKILKLCTLGAVASLSMAPLNLWPCLFLGLSGLYYYIRLEHKAGTAALYGFSFAMGYYLLSLFWVGNALLVENNPYVWAWPFAVSGLPIILSCFLALACFLYTKLSVNRYDTISYILFCLILFIADYARGYLFTGFPWNLYAYTWIDIKPIAYIASLDSIYLLHLLTLFWACLPTYLFTTSDGKGLKFTILIVMASMGLGGFCYGYYQSLLPQELASEKYEVSIVQANIKQSEKWKQENRAKNFITHVELSHFDKTQSNNKDLHLIIWPETAISQDLMNTGWVLDMISTMLKSYPGKAYLMTGALRYNMNDNVYYNSIVLYDNEGQIIHSYDKTHLVPFGEYMPLSNFIDIAPIVGFTGFKPGKMKELIDIPSGFSVIPYICYEIIFPHHYSKTQEMNADVIVNVTNDAWYGKSAGPYQHLVQSQFRAIETGLPVLRSANTGISAIISPLGNVIVQTDLMKQGRITLSLPQKINPPAFIYLSFKVVIILLLLCFFYSRKYNSTIINRE